MAKLPHNLSALSLLLSLSLKKKKEKKGKERSIMIPEAKGDV